MYLFKLESIWMEALLAISFSKFAFVMLYTNTSIILVKKNLL